MHYLHVTPAGATEADIAILVRAAQDNVQTAISTTRESVEQACTHAEEAYTQLQIAVSAEQASEAVPFIHAFLVDESKDEAPEPPQLMTV